MVASDRDLLVVGYDLERGEVVHVDDAPLPYWHARGYRRRQTLVCAMCRAGVDAPPGSLVPLVVAGRIGGERRAHFRHPPGMAPANGHEPESLWHLAVKAVLVSWARQLPNVSDVSAEWVTPDQARRSDVRVQLTDGARVAFEAQSALLSDFDWLARHQDYERLGIQEVWLWPPKLKRLPWIVVTHDQHVWEINPKTRKVTLLIGLPHRKEPDWWRSDEDGLRVYGRHAPPCVRDRLGCRDFSLGTLRLSAGGLVVPDEVRRQLETEHAEQRHLAREAHAEETARNSRRTTASTAIRSLYGNTVAKPTTSGRTFRAQSGQVPPAKPTKLTCKICGLPLSPQFANLGKHVGDCLARDR